MNSFPLKKQLSDFGSGLRLLGFLFAAMVFTSCVSLNDSVTPSAKVPSSFKVKNVEGETPRPEWWKLFRDPQLNLLIDRIDQGNFQLQAGLARIDQAYAVLGVSKADLVPNVSGSGSVGRNRSSQNDLGGQFFGNLSNQYRASVAAGWEIDLWGRVRNAVQGAQADATRVEQLTDDLRLSLQSQLTQNYFSLRFIDEERRVLSNAVATREENLKIANQRFEGELTSELDVARAEAELASTQADLARLTGTRTRLENSIAVLIGEAPADFKIASSKLDFRLPTVRPGVPMSVLENRPDVAAAVSQLDSASSRIGVARAEFFPRVNLVGSGGLSSINSGNFFDWSSRTFGIGPEVTIPVFQGGRLKADLKGARSSHAEALANYQQTTLDALREVDDSLADLAALRGERKAQLKAVKASQRSAELSGMRYREGLVSSIEVVDAVREQLNSERRVVQIRSQQYSATVRLIQSLGGGFESKFAK